MPLWQPRSTAAQCSIYLLLKDACKVTKTAAAAIAGQMSQLQASKEQAVCRSEVRGAVDRLRYITAHSTDLSLPCSSSVFCTCNGVCHVYPLSALFDLCLCGVGETLQPKRTGPKPLVEESVLNDWLERQRQQRRTHEGPYHQTGIQDVQ